jgi:hypothetical protein
MAARTPTSAPWTGGVADLVPNQRIITTPISRATDDQQFILDRSGILLSDVFSPVLVTAATWTVIRRYHIRGINRCGTDSGSEAIHCAFYAWCTPASPTGTCDFTVGIYDSLDVGDYVGLSITDATKSTHLWRGWEDDIYIETDGTEREIILAAKRDSGAAPKGVYVGGLAIYSD